MATFGQMKEDIVRSVRNRLVNADATGALTETSAAKAILGAIKYHRSREFNFNTKRTPLTTVADQDTLALPSDFERDIYLSLTEAGWKSTLTKREYGYIEDKQSDTSLTGYPGEYAIFNDAGSKKLYFYPTPQAAYALTLSHVYELTALSSDSDSNGWTTDAERLIFHHALSDIYRDRLHDTERSREHAALALDALQELLSDHYHATGTGSFYVEYL